MVSPQRKEFSIYSNYHDPDLILTVLISKVDHSGDEIVKVI
jgi:hypothetical protein